MNEFISNYRNLAEFVYFLTGPLILIAIITAALQFRLTRKEIRFRFRREATLLTLEVCDKKLSEAARLSSATFELAYKLDMPSTPKIDGYDKSTFKENDEWHKAFRSTESTELRNKAIDALNALETFAEYIHAGISDSTLAFQLEGSYFLSLSKDLRPYLAANRKTAEDDYYRCIVELEREWLTLSEQSALIKQHEVINEKIKSIPRTKSRPFLGEKI